MIFLRFTLLASLLLLLMIPPVMAQQEYQIPEITVEATIQQNGTIEFRETRQYQFEGSFSWADYKLPKAGFDEIQNIRVSEQSEDYQLSDSEEPGTFNISENDNEVVITWYYEATDTVRSFDLSYNLSGAILHGQEWSELFWTWIGSGREKNTPYFEVNIRFPKELQPDSLYYWSRAPSDLIQFSHNGSTLNFQAEALSGNQSVPVRILMPVTLFDSGSIMNREPDLILERIINEENEIIAEEERREARRATVAEHAPGLTTILSIISMGLFYFLYQRYGKRFKTLTYSTVSTTMVPSRIEPALIAKLLSFYHTGARHLTATLFDLSRRGWFKLKEQKTEKKWYQSEVESEFIVSISEDQINEPLPQWERMVVDFVIERLHEGESNFSELFSSTSATKFYPKWSKEVGKAFKERNWKDEGSLKGVYLNVIFQVLLIILSIIMMVLGGMIGVVSMIVSTILLAGSAGMIRRTKEGEQVYMQWKAYRNGLKKADERILFKGELDRHFIYAIAFGLREKELINIIDHGNQHQDGLFFTWLIIAQGSGSTPLTAAKNLSKHSALSAASVNAGTISGGGASVGAAGGGATGGAG